MARRAMPQVVRRIREHGGIGFIELVPLAGFKLRPGVPADDCERRLAGWHNVVVCVDGCRIGLTPEEERHLENWTCTPD
jgi:hypothetical protein